MQSSHDSVSVADDAPASIPPTPAAPSIPLPPRTPAKESIAAVRSTSIEDKSPNATRGKAAPSPSTQRKATLDSTTQRPVLATPTRTISGSSTGVPAVRTTPAPLPPIRYAAAAAAANVSSAPPPTPVQAQAPPPPAPVFTAPATVSQPPPGLYPIAASPAVVPTGPNTGSRQASNVSSPEMAKAIPPELASQSVSSNAPSPMIAPRLPPNLDTSSPALSAASLNVRLHSSSDRTKLTLYSQGAYANSNGLAAPPVFAASPISTPSAPLSITSELPTTAGAGPLSPASVQQERISTDPRLPSSLADLVTSFESAKQKCEL